MCVVRQQYCWNGFTSSIDWMTLYLTNIDILNYKRLCPCVCVSYLIIADLNI